MLDLVGKTNDRFLTTRLSICSFSDSIDAAIEKYGLQRVSLLRAFCQKVGIQILLRDYGLDTKNKQIFYEEDIVNVTPLVKHIHPRVRVDT